MNRAAAERRVIGIDLGGTKLSAGVISGDLTVHHHTLRPSHDVSEDDLLKLIVDVVQELREENGDEHPVEAVGLGIPSLIDQRSGTAVVSVNLPIADVPIRDLMTEKLGLPIALDNDGNVAALAEQRFGAGRGKSDIILIGLGTGVAGGIVIGGKIFRGATGSGAELGHITVLTDGPRCQGNCPNLGCLETMASGTAMGRYATEYAEANPDSELARALAANGKVTGADASDLAHAGDAGAIEVLAKAGHYLGAGLVSISNTFNPEAIVIGGGAAAGAGDFVVAPAREHLLKFGLTPNKELAEVVPAKFGPEAGMLGSAAMAFVECLDEPLENV